MKVGKLRTILNKALEGSTVTLKLTDGSYLNYQSELKVAEIVVSEHGEKVTLIGDINGATKEKD